MERQTRSLALKLEEENFKAALAERRGRQEAEEKLSDTAKRDQRLETAFLRLFPLNPKKLTLLEKIFEPQVSIAYREFANLFTKARGLECTETLGFLESSRGGSHRKMVLPSFNTFPFVERLGYFRS